jgi:hypothetical protein
MNKGLTPLIKHIENIETKNAGITTRAIVEHIRIGVITEPEKMGDLINAYNESLDRVRANMSPGLRLERTLQNIASYVTLADHDFEEEMLVRSATEEIKDSRYYIENTDEYGAATTVFAEHFGIKGKDLKDLVFGETSLMPS